MHRLIVRSGEMTIIYRAEGRGTTLLSQKRTGDEVDVLGPLGNGFPVEETAPGETAILVGGGIGVPPLYELSKQLTAKGVKCVHVLGFQSEDVVFYKEQFSALGDTHIVTVDGTAGTAGFVTTVMEKLGMSSQRTTAVDLCQCLMQCKICTMGKKDSYLSNSEWVAESVLVSHVFVKQQKERTRHTLKYARTVLSFQQGWCRYEQAFN